MSVDQFTNANPDGSVFGQSVTEKLGFYGVTPVIQQATVAAGTDAATTQTCANGCRTALRALGFMA